MEGRYQVLDVLGRGGMSTVHRAKDSVLGREVAIKRLLPHLAADDDAVRRFLNEAQAAAGLNHPGIVTVHDSGVDEGGPYIVMELVRGETVADKLASSGALDVPTSSAILLRAADALDHAHAHGVIHRDIKPSNLIVEPTGAVRITDFGIASTVDDSTFVTSPDLVIGTATYMAPERLAGVTATPASDIYSLGAVAYEMLTGRPPHEAENIAALLAGMRDDPPDPMGSDVPAETATAVRHALDKDPSRRPASASAFATALLAGATIPMPTVAPPGTTPEDPTRRLVTIGSGPSSRRGLLPVALLVALGLILSLFAVGSGIGEQAPGAVSPTSTIAATTTQPPTTTTLSPPTTPSPDSSEVMALAISELLSTMGPPEFKRGQVKDVEESLTEVLDRAAEDDRQALRDALEKAFEEARDLPGSGERTQLEDHLVRLAESYGFTVSSGEEDD